MNDKSNRLNKIVQENVNIKTQLEKIISNNNKNEQKMKYYEEQLDYYKNIEFEGEYKDDKYWNGIEKKYYDNK